MDIHPLIRISAFLFCAQMLLLNSGGLAQAKSGPPPQQQLASGTHSHNVLHLLNTVTIPNTSRTQWCYDTAIADDGSYYLADNDRAGIDVIHDGKQPASQAIIGKGQFTGIGGCKTGTYDTDGPNGLVIAGEQIFAGDGNSSVRVYQKDTGRFITRIATGGHLRYDARDQMVIVANGSERDDVHQDAPFLSFISTKPGKTYDTLVKTLLFPHANALEQPQWDPFDGKLYLSLPSSDQNPTGEVDVIDLATMHVTSIPTPNCADAGLAFAPQGIAAVGCANGDQIVLNLRTHHLTRIPVTGVDIVAADAHFLFFASYGSNTHAPQLAITTLQGHLLQTIPLATTSHTVTIDMTDGHVYVPLDGGQVEIFQEAC
jgi:hypothetical protein